MKVPVAASLVLLFVACSGEPPKNGQPVMSAEPVSVRGWVADVDGSGGDGSTYRTVETEAARRAQLFQSINVYVENSPYVSGGMAENGSFLLLDVPPGKVTVVFQAPGAPAARLVMQNIPGNADVFVPALLLKKDGVTLLQPKELKVRLAASIDKAKPTGATANINGQLVPVMETPYAQMEDRRDWPAAPSVTPATVR
ncbi:MAG: hypothetical protein QOI24_2243 [Acidobacteriota bacterium]|jgi:hypothetical protein|nr:hypothetical protein [Acidobacteriota bacterium]